MKHSIHRYVRKKFNSGTIYYKCILPNCPHYVLEPMIWNKIMICNNCNEDFILTKRKQNQAKPKCLNCTGKKDHKLDKLIEGLF